MADLPRPPVPKKLQELLHDYPGHIERLQKQLNLVAAETRPASSKFEVATWMLEGQLDEFIREAQKELEAIQVNGSAEAIAQADQKKRLMSQASWKHVWLTDKALLEHFQDT